MKLASMSLVPVAAFCLAAPSAVYAQAGASSPSPTSQNSGMSGDTGPRIRGHREAMRMVAARAVLKETLDAKKTQTGSAFHASLAQKIQLENGPELPSGTVLNGIIGTDEVQGGDASKLVLRFMNATLKNGQIVPVKATIVGVYKPAGGAVFDHPMSAGDQMPNSWNDGTLQVEQLNVISGVDLRSAIASRNSGVFTSNTGKDIELRLGTELQLAIAQAPTQRSSGSGGSQ